MEGRFHFFLVIVGVLKLSTDFINYATEVGFHSFPVAVFFLNLVPSCG